MTGKREKIKETKNYHWSRAVDPDSHGSRRDNLRGKTEKMQGKWKKL